MREIFSYFASKIINFKYILPTPIKTVYHNNKIYDIILSTVLEGAVTVDQIDFFVHPPYNLELELIKNIKACDRANAHAVLREINSLKRAVLSHDPLRSLKNSLIASATFYSRAIIEAGVDPDEAFTLCDNLILELESIQNLANLTDFEYAMLDRFIDLGISLSFSKFSKPIRQAMEYIHSRLTQKLTLSGVAAAAFMHPNYLSALFKKEAGVSVNAYILKKKIEDCAFCLKTTNRTISEIALSYHFCNQSYFTKVFKKYCGVTPEEYRKGAGGPTGGQICI